MVTTVKVTIYDSQIQVNFDASAGKDAEKVGSAAVRNSRGFVGKRSGYLASTITFGRQPVGRLRYVIRLNAGAYYATWVEKGTTGVLLTKGQYRALKPGNGYPRLVVTNQFLRGQAGQHYLERGMNVSLVSHGYAPLSDA